MDSSVALKMASEMAQTCFKNMASENGESLSPEQERDLENSISKATEEIKKMNLDKAFAGMMPSKKKGKGKNKEQTDQISSILSGLMSQATEQTKSDERGQVSPATAVVADTHSEKKKKKKKKKKVRKTPDLHFDLEVSLEDLYYGTPKVLSKKLSRIKGDIVEKSKEYINVPIQPGQTDEDQICIEGKSNEDIGAIPGDIVFQLCMKPHEVFERDDANLIIENVDIGLYESFFSGYYFKHLNGKTIHILPQEEAPLHGFGGTRLLRGYGMPQINEEGTVRDTDGNICYGDLYVQFSIQLPETISDKEVLEELCPPLNETPENSEDDPILELVGEVDDDFVENSSSGTDDTYDVDEESEDEESDDEESDSSLVEVDVDEEVDLDDILANITK